MFVWQLLGKWGKKMFIDTKFYQKLQLNHQTTYYIPIGSQQYQKKFFLKTFIFDNHLMFSFWLNCFMDDCHFNYRTKIEKKH
jgi:hypothetical protein